MTYKTGSARMAADSAACTCDLKWLGWRSAQIAGAQLPQNSKQALTKGDKKCIETLLGHDWIKSGTPESNKYVYELQQMTKLGVKVELEACLAKDLSFLEQLLTREIAAQLWI